MIRYKRVATYCLHSLLLMIGIIGFVCFFYNARQLGSTFLISFQNTIQQLLTFHFWQNFFHTYQNSGQGYSLKLIGTSLLFTLVFFIGYAYLYRFLKGKQLYFLQQFFSYLEIFPVVALVLFLQWGFISLYKTTGVHLLSTIGTPRQPIFIVPFLILNLFPCIFLINYMTPYIKDAYQSDYFLFAHSLGFSNLRLFFTYLLPNLIRPLETIIGLIYLEMLSVMIFIELQFNTGGLITSLYQALTDFPPPLDPYVFISAYLFVLLIPYVIVKGLFKSYRFI